MNTTIYEESDFGDVPVDVYQKLANDRILFITGQITDNLAADITATLLLKDHESSDEIITIFINSIGGDIRNVFMIYDMIKMIDAPVETICVGQAFGEAVILLAAGSPGLRFATKNSVIAISQLEQHANDQMDIVNTKKYLELFTEDNLRMMKIIAEAADKPLKKVMVDFNRMVFMPASKALSYGLVDQIVKFNK